MGFVLVLVAILAFLFWVSAPPEPNGVVLYFANIGTGKTTYLSKLVQAELKRMDKGKSKYRYIVSNAVISGVIYEPNFRALLKRAAMADTLLLIDEGSIEYNNRKMNLTEHEIRYLKLIRHYKSTIIVVSQSHDDVDVTLRRLYTQIYLLRYLPFFTLIQPIKKKVGIDEVTKQIIDEYQFRWPFSWRVFLRPLYFKYFDSWWVPPDIEIIDFELEEFKAKLRPRYKRERKWFGLVKGKELQEELSGGGGGSPDVSGGHTSPDAIKTFYSFYPKSLIRKILRRANENDA
ncbi:hypothetical protein Dhaf_2709 [Desulfitobacterium hafniense DCB-2]|uniref:Zona occludens toxin N-terminal domain-containing protein n=1 Tax=Desulfitobacterium hafniense (strain DSM 10664 / DCB-2) TaxID=272564 RepID=B8FWC3_DESHD|nr:hypothetical protein [Desulfitobacterium hafniense]ACL20735.1 hypothetical protein Dhaf_2709 [Desulfitobacterium hafniense DCB-2]